MLLKPAMACFFIVSERWFAHRFGWENTRLRIALVEAGYEQNNEQWQAQHYILNKAVSFMAYMAESDTAYKTWLIGFLMKAAENIENDGIPKKPRLPL